MPNIYCSKCRQEQLDGEKVCSKCGTPYGGNAWHVLLGLALAVLPPVALLLTGDRSASLTTHQFLQVLVYWVSPVLLATLVLADSNGRRVTTYLYVGGGLILLGVILLSR